jgi:5-methylcytosine-specific restriction endonuclease McrA
MAKVLPGYGRIRRSSSARHAFRELHPCPATGLTAGSCPGYVVDHVVPLKRGGADSPENMQWQSTAEVKAKDRVE